MSFGDYALTFGQGLKNYGNIAATILGYFGIRFMLGRFAVRETVIRLVLGLACLMLAVNSSTLAGAQILRDGWKASWIINLAPVLMLFVSAFIGIQHGAIRNPFKGWVRVPASAEEGRKPAEVDQQSRRVATG